MRLYVQKYFNMGIASIPEKLVVYTEGSLLFDVAGVASSRRLRGVYP